MPSVSRDIRVLMTADAVGGVWRYAVGAARSLADLEVRVGLVGMGPAPSAAQMSEATVLGIPVHWLDENLDWMVSGYEGARHIGCALDAHVATVRPDVVHINAPALAPFLTEPPACLVAAHSCLATWWRAVKQGEPPTEWLWHRRLTQIGLTTSVAALAPSAAYASALRSTYGDLPNLRVVHNGAEPIAPAPKEPFVLAAGRWWDEAKNLAAIDAVAERSAWPIRVAGPSVGPSGQRIEAKSVHCLGELSYPELSRWIARAPVFISLSIYEPFGLSVLEAASAGAALVLSDIPTFRELWRDCAFFVEPADTKAAARALNSLAQDDRLRMRMAKAAMTRARTYSLGRQGRALAAIYRTALQPEKSIVEPLCASSC